MRLATLGIVILAAALLVGCGRSETVDEHKGHEAPKVEKKTIYTCSMHPQIQQDHPGRCPICGMNLTPMEEASTQEAEVENKGHSAHEEKSVKETIRLSSAQDSVASVELTRVKKDTLSRPLSIYGEIKAIQDKAVSYTWVYGGRVERLLIPYTTTEVKQGEGLLEVYSEEAIDDQQMYLQAVKERYLTTFYERRLASAQIETYRQKLLRAGMTEAELDALIKEKKIKTTFTIAAPISGSLLGALPTTGVRFMPQDSLFKLANIDEVWFVGRVYEQDVGALKLNQSATLRLKAYPESKIDGTVIFIDRFIDPTSRTLETRLLVKNEKHKILPDMAGEALIALKNERSTLLVPESAVIDTGKRKIVYIKEGENTYKQQEVLTGNKGALTEGGKAWVEITSGLKEGQEVVSSGAFVIDAEAQLKGVGASHQH